MWFIHHFCCLARRRRKILWFYDRKWRFYPFWERKLRVQKQIISFNTEFFVDTYPQNFSRIHKKWISCGYISPKKNTGSVHHYLVQLLTRIDEYCSESLGTNQLACKMKTGKIRNQKLKVNIGPAPGNLIKSSVRYQWTINCRELLTMSINFIGLTTWSIIND